MDRAKRAVYVCLNSDDGVQRSIEASWEVWDALFRGHPLLNHYADHPTDRPRRWSDVTSVTRFRQSVLHHDFFKPFDIDHQAVLFLGDGFAQRLRPAAPLSIGLALNRTGMDFTERDIQGLALLKRLCAPIFRAKRAAHYVNLINAARYTPEMERCLMAFGLTPRQAEVCFWMLQGKSNTDIGDIVGIGAQTVRHHSMSIFRRLGVYGRMDMQRAVIQQIAVEQPA